jgi:periplasmic protein TonB
MKLDIFTNLWLDIVFEGRNKKYGAYELRKENPKTAVKSLVIGTVIFSLLVSAPLIASFLPDFGKGDESLDTKIVTVKLKAPEKPKDNLPPPPPPPPKVDQVKFVKPVVAKAEEVTEEPPKVEEIKDKKIGAETIKGDPDAELTVEPVGNGPEPIDETIYSSAGLEVQPEFPGGIGNFYKGIARNYVYPEGEEINGKVVVSFVVEKDGSLTDIKVLRDLGYGTGAEAIRVLKKLPKWSPGEQNGRKVRASYVLPIALQTAAE